MSPEDFVKESLLKYKNGLANARAGTSKDQIANKKATDEIKLRRLAIREKAGKIKLGRKYQTEPKTKSLLFGKSTSDSNQLEINLAEKSVKKNNKAKLSGNAAICEIKSLFLLDGTSNSPIEIALEANLAEQTVINNYKTKRGGKKGKLGCPRKSDKVLAVVGKKMGCFVNLVNSKLRP